jgi:uncharacterized membrane protein YcaP (DUF421 family)
MWFDSWPEILRTFAVGSVSYLALVLVLRFSGKRMLGQLNAFDFIVTVAIGSTLATILLSPTVSWAEGGAAFVLLGLLQFLVAWISSRWPRVRSLLTAEPTVLLREGRFVHEALRKNRLTESEIRQAVRSSGSGDLRDIAAVVLETNGKLSVITKSSLGDGSALKDLR